MSFRDPFSRHFAGYNDDILTSANAHVVIFLYLHFPQEASFQEGKVRDGNFYAETSAPAPGWAGERAWLRGAEGCGMPRLRGAVAGRAQRGGQESTDTRQEPLPSLQLDYTGLEGKGGEQGLFWGTAEPTWLQTSPASV